ncbi:Integral membrane protein, partial [Trichostrongylus colubriformis]
MSTAFCFGIRFPMFICMSSFAIIPTSIVVERAIALWKRNKYEHYGCRLGFAISIICIVVSLIMSAWSMGKMNLSDLTVYCSATTNETADRITIICFTYCGIDVITLSGMAWLRTSNVAAMKGKYSDLRSSYQLRENASVIRVLLPLVVFDGLSHLVFSLGGGVFLLFRVHFSYVAYRTI